MRRSKRIQERHVTPVQTLVYKRLQKPVGHHSPVLERKREVRRKLILPVCHHALIALSNSREQILISIVFDSVAHVCAEVFPRALISRRSLAVYLDPTSGRVDPSRAARNHDCALSDVAREDPKRAPVKSLSGYSKPGAEPEIEVAACSVRIDRAATGSPRRIARHSQQSRVVTADPKAGLLAV